VNIVVCIKQVPINTANVIIDNETRRLKREDVESVINPFDEYALEEAVRLKEKVGGKVVAVTMGHSSAESVLREAISKGANDGVLLSDIVFCCADTLATSYTLSMAIKLIIDYDIILCGKQTSDSGTAQVGPGIAEMLNIPHVACVKKIELIDEKLIRVQRMMEDGYDLIESQLPVLLTVVKEINIPRIASLKGKIAAKKAVIRTLNAADIDIDIKRVGFDGSPTQVIRVSALQQRFGGEKLCGSAQEVASSLIRKLSDIGIVL
jgi:electron transfer flavoprotein beta subunit